MPLKKKNLVLLIYCFYVLSLFGLTVYYQLADERSPSLNFATDFSKGLGRFIKFFWFVVISTWLFLIIIYRINNPFSLAFILLAPLLHFLIALLVFLPIDLVLWICQWKLALSGYQQLFLLASISATLLMIWISGDLFRDPHKPDRIQQA